MKGMGRDLLALCIFLSLVLPTSVSALPGQKILEIRKLVWDEENGVWNDLVYADAGDILRFRIVITYHDPDGKGPSYKIRWISIEDRLSPHLEYLGNATLEESIVSDGIVRWENISGVELFDGESFSLEYDVRVLDDGIHTNVVEVRAFETCPHVWHIMEARVTIYAIDHPASKDRDVDDDGNNEMAVDANLDLRDGFEDYQDGDNSSRAIKTIDGDLDGKKDHFIDVDGNNEPDRYWDPDDDILSDVESRDADHDTKKEWIFDSDGDGNKESYYDPSDGSIHLLDITPPVVRIIKPEEGYLYRYNIKIRRILFGVTKVIGPINIKVDARDDSGIDRVEFYIDGELKHVDDRAPYSWFWIAKPLGLAEKHTIEVRAYDIYGNLQTDSITVVRLRSGVFLGLALLTMGSGLIVGKLLAEKPEEPSPPAEPPAEVNAPPVASIDVAEKGYVGEEIILNASHSYDPDGEIISYRWDFGDGAIAEGEVVTHVYKEAGRYRITLEVMDDGGETDTAEAYIEILQREGSISAGDGLICGVVVLSLISLVLLILLILRRRG